MKILPLLKDNPKYVKPNRLTQQEEELYNVRKNLKETNHELEETNRNL